MYTLSVWVCYLSDGFKVPHTLKDSTQDERKQIMRCVNCSTTLVWSVDTCSHLLYVALYNFSWCISQALCFIMYTMFYCCSQGISFEEFRSFFQFLNNLEDFTIAMQMYNFANRSIGQGKASQCVVTYFKLSQGFSASCNLRPTS